MKSVITVVVLVLLSIVDSDAKGRRGGVGGGSAAVLGGGGGNSANNEFVFSSGSVIAQSYNHSVQVAQAIMVDLDGDGKPEIIRSSLSVETVNSWTSEYTHSIQVSIVDLKNQSLGKWTVGGFNNKEERIELVSLVDTDEDGIPELWTVTSKGVYVAEILDFQKTAKAKIEKEIGAEKQVIK